AMIEVGAPVQVNGIYGVLTNRADGSYSYDLDEQDADTSQLIGTASDIFTYRVSDAKGGTDLGQLTITVAPVPPKLNSAPVSVNDMLAAVEDNASIYVPADLLSNDHDDDHDILTVTAVSIIAGGSVALNAEGAVSFMPASNFNGTASFSYTVQDGEGGSTSATASVVVAAVNDAPSGVASADLAHGTQDTAYTLTVAELLAGFSDADGDPLGVDGLQASDGSIAPTGDEGFIITPSSGYSGPVTLTYEVVDGKGGAISATQTYQLTAINHAPEGQAAISLPDGFEDTPYVVAAADLLKGFTDQDGDQLTISGVTAGPATIGEDGANFTISAPDNY
ncbi:MAG: tandem-95 repeat protein, partial [Hyphomicrobiales bacterium]